MKKHFQVGDCSVVDMNSAVSGFTGGTYSVSNNERFGTDNQFFDVDTFIPSPIQDTYMNFDSAIEPVSHKSRWAGMAQTYKHRKEVQRIAKEKGLSFPFHDLDKYPEYLFLGKGKGSEYHRAHSDHHYHDGDIKNKEEAAIDWESARFTKPDKPLDAYETWKKYYPDVDMEPTLRKLGLWHEEDNKMSFSRKYYRNKYYFSAGSPKNKIIPILNDILPDDCVCFCVKAMFGKNERGLSVDVYLHGNPEPYSLYDLAGMGILPPFIVADTMNAIQDVISVYANSGYSAYTLTGNCHGESEEKFINADEQEWSNSDGSSYGYTKSWSSSSSYHS